MSRYIRQAVRRKGFDMIHYTPWQNLFQRFSVDLILDVGANRGQTYESFRWAGFTGPICSFEPCPETYAKLEAAQGHDWKKFQYALSNRSGELKFYVTSHPGANGLHKSDGGPEVRREIMVQAFRLDELWPKQGFNAKNAFLKIDAEGHDLEVVKGATGVLDRIPLIMLETAPLPRFVGEPALPEVVSYLDKVGYSVCRVEKCSSNPEAGIDTALDIVFARRDVLEKIGGAKFSLMTG